MKTIKPIEQIAEELGIGKDSLEFYGNYKAKIPLENIKNNKSKLIVVTAITPTPLGEGKSTTAIGLTQGFGKINKNVALTIRQPSLGPVFGHKGGGTGGGIRLRQADPAGLPAMARRPSAREAPQQGGIQATGQGQGGRGLRW